MHHSRNNIYEWRKIVAELFEEPEEELLYPPIVYDGEGNEHPYELYYMHMEKNKVGDIVRSSIAAPGYGYVEYRITRMDDSGIYGVLVNDQSGELEPWMVEDGEKPYATMKDGPGKYLFRKDGKQKLVGSVDNELKDERVGRIKSYIVAPRWAGADDLLRRIAFENDLDIDTTISSEALGLRVRVDFILRGKESNLRRAKEQFERSLEEYNLNENDVSGNNIDGYQYREERDRDFDDDNEKIWHYAKAPGEDWTVIDRTPYAEMGDVAWELYKDFHKKHGRWPNKAESRKIEELEYKDYS